MSEIKNLFQTWMVLSTVKCTWKSNYLTPLHFKGLNAFVVFGTNVLKYMIVSK